MGVEHGRTSEAHALAERDVETDRARIEAIMDTIESALQATEREQSGLNRRSRMCWRAAVTFGNGNDEYMEREALDNHHQDL